jgi:hypothetical protein
MGGGSGKCVMERKDGFPLISFTNTKKPWPRHAEGVRRIDRTEAYTIKRCMIKAEIKESKTEKYTIPKIKIK